MAGTDTYPLVDRIVPGGLADYLTTARHEGASYESIAFDLRADHDITVSVETVRKWCLRANADDSDRAAS
jgi:hypothetical protein